MQGVEEHESYLPLLEYATNHYRVLFEPNQQNLNKDR